MAVKLLGDLSASGNATFNSEVNLPSGGQIDWANGDARIEEGLVTNYSLSFQTWTGSALTTKMFIQSGGNVGIGTTSPTTKLEVGGFSTNTSSIKAGSLEIQSYAINNGWFAENLYYNGSAGGWTLRNAGYATKIYMQDGAIEFKRAASGAAGSTASITSTMRLLNNGNVGIGTTAPLEKLHVVGKINSSNNIVSNSTYTMFTGRSNRTTDDYGGLNKEYFKANLVTAGPNTTGEASAHGIADLRFQLANSPGNTNMSDIMTLRSGGNVGIGTTTPDSTLQIVGNNSTAGTLTLNDANKGDQRSHIHYGSNGDWYIRSAAVAGKIILQDNGGNVGIGTTGPDTKLEVNGQASFGNNSTLAIQNDAFVTVRATAFAGIDVKSLRTSGNIGGLRAYDSNGTVQGQLLLKVDGGFEFYNSDSRLYITSGGNVGIGTTSPSVKLHVDSGGIRATGTTSTTGQIDASPNFGAFRFYDGSTFYGGLGMGQWAGAGANTDIVQYLSANVNYHVSNTTTPVLTVSSAGNVGIGTTSPTNELQVIGNIDATGVISQTFWTNDSIRKLSANASLNFRTAAGPIEMILDGSGNLGIGTSTPSSKLEVVGSGGTVLDIQGSVGQLFSVTDSLTGDLFAVSDISGIPILNVNSSGAVDIDGTLNLGDSNKIQLGASQDLQIYHDGTHNYIDGITNDLYIRTVSPGDDVVVQAYDDLFLYTNNGADAIIARGGAAVEVYHNNVKKLETTSTGVTVTGNISATNFSGSSSGTNTGDQDLSSYLTAETFSSSDVVMSLSGTDVIAGESITLAGGLSYSGTTLTSADTTYTVGDGGLTQNNFTTTLKNKLDGIAASANNYSLPANIPATSVAIGSTVTLSESTDRADLLYVNSGTSTWGGLQIGNTSNEFIFSLMGDGNQGGIYDDQNGDWIIYWDENAGVKLNHNNNTKLQTTSTGITITGEIVTTGGNSTNWNTAYGWGNHGSAGYLTTSSAASTYAPLASPALTGTPTAPTAAAATNTTQLATTAFVQTAVSNLVDSAPGTLDTLNELAAALGDDASFSTTVSTALGNRLRIDVNNQSLSSTELANARTNLGLGTAATAATGDFATAAQGTLADSALQSETFSSSDVVMSLSGNDVTAGESITLAGGLSYSGTTLTSANDNTTYTAGTGLTLTGTSFSVTANTYATAAQGTTADAALPKAGGTMTGGLTGTTATFSGQAHFKVIGNSNGGSILMGPSGSGVNKWSYLAGTHYNQDTGSGNGSGSAGVAVIGCLSTSTYNKVLIGGNPYEINPATQIEFWTHTATTHTTGGSVKMKIAGDGVITFSTYGAGILKTNASGVVSLDTNTYSTATGVENNADVTDTANVVAALTAGTNVQIAANGTISATDTNTTYTVGDGGLTQKNFTTTLKDKLDGIAASATNVTNNNQLTNGAGYLTAETFSSSDVVLSLSGTDVIAGDSITLAGGLSYNASTKTLSQTDNNTVYTHPTSAGNKHIPTGGSSGQFLKYSSSGTAVWATPSYTTNTDTQLSDSYVRGLYTGGTNVSITAAGVISSTNTTYSTADFDAAGSAATVQSNLDSVAANVAGISNQSNTDVDTGTETIAQVSKGTYTAAFFDFVIKNGTNVRAGTVYSCHDGTNVEFTETSTVDLGDTSDVSLSVDISGTNMRLRATTTSNNWSVKSLVRAI